MIKSYLFKITMRQQGTVLLTGASGGLGTEFAHLFAKDGYKLVLVALEGDKLKELAADLERTYRTQSETIVADLSQPSAPGMIFEEITKRSLTIDILVNNAGFGVYGPFVETDLNKELSMMHVNMDALTALTKLFLKGMVERKHGKILNVASTAAFQPGPLSAVYFASKGYVLSFTQAIRSELKGSGVSVTTLCPGPTATGFGKRSGMDNSKLFQRMMKPSVVAKKAYEGLMCGKSIVVPGLKNKLLAFSNRLLPRDWATALVRLANGKVK